MYVLQNQLYAQLKFCIHANCGISTFIEKDNEPQLEIGNYYTALPSYGFGGDAVYSFKNSKFGIISGLNVSSFASENHLPDHFIIPEYGWPDKRRNWEERFYSLSIPLQLNYKFEEWIHINGGLSNTVHLNKPKDIIFSKKINQYTLNFIGGIDFVIKQRVIIGAMYYRDIIPTMLYKNTDDIKYSIEQITVKIGFILTK